MKHLIAVFGLIGRAGFLVNESAAEEPLDRNIRMFEERFSRRHSGLPPPAFDSRPPLSYLTTVPQVLRAAGVVHCHELLRPSCIRFIACNEFASAHAQSTSSVCLHTLNIIPSHKETPHNEIAMVCCCNSRTPDAHFFTAFAGSARCPNDANAGHLHDTDSVRVCR